MTPTVLRLLLVAALVAPPMPSGAFGPPAAGAAAGPCAIAAQAVNVASYFHTHRSLLIRPKLFKRAPGLRTRVARSARPRAPQDGRRVSGPRGTFPRVARTVIYGLVLTLMRGQLATMPTAMFAQDSVTLQQAADAERAALAPLIARAQAGDAAAEASLSAMRLASGEAERALMDYLLLRVHSRDASPVWRMILNARLNQNAERELTAAIDGTLHDGVEAQAWELYEAQLIQAVERGQAWDVSDESIALLVAALQNDPTSAQAGRILWREIKNGVIPERWRKEFDWALKLASIRGDDRAVKRLTNFDAAARGAGLPAAAGEGPEMNFELEAESPDGADPGAAERIAAQLERIEQAVAADGSAAERLGAGTVRRIAELALSPDARLGPAAWNLLNLAGTNSDGLRQAAFLYMARYAAENRLDIPDDWMRPLLIAALNSRVDYDAVELMLSAVSESVFDGLVPSQLGLRHLLNSGSRVHGPMPGGVPEMGPARHASSPGALPLRMSYLRAKGVLVPADGSPVTIPIELALRGSNPWISTVQFTAVLPPGARLIGSSPGSAAAGKSVSANPANGIILIAAANHIPLTGGVVASITVEGLPPGQYFYLPMTGVIAADEAGGAAALAAASGPRGFVRRAAVGAPPQQAAAAKLLAGVLEEAAHPDDPAAAKRLQEFVEPLLTAPRELLELAKGATLDPEVIRKIDERLIEIPRHLGVSGVPGYVVKAAGMGALDACAVTGATTATIADFVAVVAMTLGEQTCTADIVAPGVCNAVVVQRVANAITNPGLCPVGPNNPHNVMLTWTASTSNNVAWYNMYRITLTSGSNPPATPYPILAAQLKELSYTDLAVDQGGVYAYYATAVAVNADGVTAESAPSNIAVAVIPNTPNADVKGSGNESPARPSETQNPPEPSQPQSPPRTLGVLIAPKPAQPRRAASRLLSRAA